MIVITYVDASLKAYGAIVYLHREYKDTTACRKLISSKTKVAPLKPISVPRLELIAAVMELRLIPRPQSNTLKYRWALTAILHSDNNDVFWWISVHGREPSSSLRRAFVANRIGEIQMNTERAQWNHVPTDQSPADLCTRSGTPEKLCIMVK